MRGNLDTGCRYWISIGLNADFSRKRYMLPSYVPARRDKDEDDYELQNKGNVRPSEKLCRNLVEKPRTVHARDSSKTALLSSVQRCVILLPHDLSYLGQKPDQTLACRVSRRRLNLSLLCCNNILWTCSTWTTLTSG